MRRLLTTLLIASATALIAGCGGDDDGGSGKAATFTAGQPVKVIAKDYSFDPGDITVEGGGGKVTIELKNDGALAHNLIVEQDGNEIGGTPTFQGGETKSGDVDLQPGDYEFICSVGDHADRGMKGKLVVK